MGFKTTCTTERLADGEHCAVDRCSCGTITVHIGRTSMRLPETMLAELTHVMNIALVTSREPRDDVASHLHLVAWGQS